MIIVRVDNGDRPLSKVDKENIEDWVKDLFQKIFNRLPYTVNWTVSGNQAFTILMVS